MAAYSESFPRLSFEEVSFFLKKNHLPDLKHIRSIRKNTESSIYSIITEKENYILTLYEDNLLDLSNLKKITSHFTAKGFPFAKILEIGTLMNNQAILSSHMEGKSKKLWDDRDYEKIGFFLGNLHKCSENSNTPLNSTTPFIWSLSKAFYEIQYKIPAEFQRLEQEIFFIEESWPQNISKGLIHGDIWKNNILFTNETISGVLDFNPIYEPFILDLANIIKGIPTENTTALASLISNYELIRRLSNEEWDSLHLMVSAKFLTTILYFLTKGISLPNRKDEFLTYAFLNLIKLDSWKEQAELITQ